MQNRERIAAESKEKYKANPEPNKRRAREWRRLNSERSRVRDKAYHVAHKDELREKQREYVKRNRSHINISRNKRRARFRIEHPEDYKSMLAELRENQRQRALTDLEWKAKRNAQALASHHKH